MLTLGIETSGREGSVAVLDTGGRQGVRDLSRYGKPHASALLTAVRELLTEMSVSPSAVRVVAVSLGPGSFTGLRVGVTCAKTWAYASGARLVAVDTFQAIAEQYLAEPSESEASRIAVISDAQRGDLFVGHYERDAVGQLHAVGCIDIQPVDAFLMSVTDALTVTGPAVEALRERLSGRCCLAPSGSAQPHAATIARIGARSAGIGADANFWSLEPLYLRRSAAEEKADSFQ